VGDGFVDTGIVASGNGQVVLISKPRARARWAQASFIEDAVADRDLLSLSVKTRISSLRTRQIDHPLGQGATKPEGQLV
jgi:hypothetical protein